jgi:serine/threonine protein kinase
MTKNSYTYVRDLGKGAYGDVVLAKDGAGQLHAVKCLKLDYITKRTPMEIFNHKKLQHPYIIQFKEIFSDANGLYIVMEFASKGDLLTHIQNTPLCRLDEDEARCGHRCQLLPSAVVHQTCLRFIIDIVALYSAWS